MSPTFGWGDIKNTFRSLFLGYKICKSFSAVCKINENISGGHNFNQSKTKYEPSHGKSNNLHMQNKDADQLHCNCEADHIFVFTIRIVPFLYFVSPKFQASSLLLWMYSLVCVRSGCKPKLLVFSHTGSI